MKRILALSLVLIALLGITSPAFAIKEFNDQWKATYAEKDPIKGLSEAAKCNVCHVQGEDKKTVRNPYGQEVAKILKKKDIVPRMKTEPDKCKAEMEAAFKKIESIKAKDGKTYGEKIKAGELPGGNKDGK
jgi:hypothetical protein